MRAFDVRWGERLGDPICPYLRRWVIEIFGFAVRLHHWYSSDDSRAPHDHPYSIVTVVLKGGYDDVVYRRAGKDWALDRETISKIRRRPGSIQRWSPLHTHYVDVHPGGCWTLIFTGRRVRNWGFWTARWDKRRRWMKSNRYFLEHGNHPCE
jgi:hypothetical protein